MMNRPTARDLVLFALLISFGVAARVGLQHIPNFAPVAAIALFAGYVLSNRILALATPLAIMLISDRLVEAGGYSLPLMLTVYGLLALPVFFSTIARRYLSFHQKTKSSSIRKAIATLTGLVGCSLACSLIFFLGTNFMVWLAGSLYEPTMAGLFSCYASAVPFFRYTLVGDAVFSLVLFGSLAAAHGFASEADMNVAADAS